MITVERFAEKRNKRPQFKIAYFIFLTFWKYFFKYTCRVSIFASSGKYILKDDGLVKRVILKRIYRFG